jgi:hypothetical protein
MDLSSFRPDFHPPALSRVANLCGRCSKLCIITSGFSESPPTLSVSEPIVKEGTREGCYFCSMVSRNLDQQHSTLGDLTILRVRYKHLNETEVVILQSLIQDQAIPDRVSPYFKRFVERNLIAEQMKDKDEGAFVEAPQLMIVRGFFISTGNFVISTQEGKLLPSQTIS